MKKSYLLVVVIMVLIAFGIHYFDFDSKTITGKLVEPSADSYVSDSGTIEVYFCPHQDCVTPLVSFLNSAQESIHCAMFEIDHPEIQQALLDKSKNIEVKIVTDNDYLYEFNHSFVKTDSWGLMHNKFCVVDGKKFSSGSMNPTVNCAHKNNNNLLLIDSKILAENYEAEFQEMWNGTFKKGSKVLTPQVQLENTTISSYFCPEDDCAERVKNKLEQAQESIYFMTFSFTHEGIANILLLKHTDGIPIHGVMEARQVTKYSQFSRLDYQDIDVIKDGNPQNLHHKVFIIDNETVITGSFNPTEGGDERNDENILIIKDANLAKLFLEEYAYVRAEADNN